MPVFGDTSFSSARSPLSGLMGRFLIGGVIALVAFIGYCSNSSQNQVTGRTQRLALSVPQEIALGLQSAPEMVRQFGGLCRDPEKVRRFDRVGRRLLEGIAKNVKADANPYQYDFHLLDDDRTINAFALPGGQVFITEALYDRLRSEGQLAGVLGHEIMHVLGRHSSAQIAKSNLLNTLAGAATVAASSDMRSAWNTQQIASMVAGVIGLKYGRSDELESDEYALRFMVWACYDPRSMIEVMKILKEASGGRSQPEWLSSHPDPGNRIEAIEAKIRELWPQGLPAGLEP